MSKRKPSILLLLFLAAGAACAETGAVTETTETEEVSELASCRTVLPTADEIGIPRATVLRADAPRTACEELNEHEASIAHISAMLDNEVLELGEEGAAR